MITRKLQIKHDYGKNDGNDGNDDIKETYVIVLMEKPNNSSLQVNVKFISQLSETLQGFYRVGYHGTDSSSKK